MTALWLRQEPRYELGEMELPAGLPDCEKCLVFT